MTPAALLDRRFHEARLHLRNGSDSIGQRTASPELQPVFSKIALWRWRSAKLIHFGSDKLIHPYRTGRGSSSFQVVAFSK
jgi:hypothetical protein